jgi:hypothetical protein
MQFGRGCSFTWGTFDIERIIGNRMVCLGFLGYGAGNGMATRYLALGSGMSAKF